MQNLIIKPVKESDAKKVLIVFKEIARTSRWLLTAPDEAPKSVKEELKFIRHHTKAKNCHLALAEINGEAVGFVGADGGRKRRNSHVAVVGIAIRNRWRGKGIGKAMMKYIIDWAKNAGLKKLRLSVISKNRIAHNLYIKTGFKKEGLFKRELKIGGKYYDTIEMAKFI